MPTRARTGKEACAQVRGGWRALALAVLLLAAMLLAHVSPALALKAIEINNDLDRIELGGNPAAHHRRLT
jgi:hypothetical protein